VFVCLFVVSAINQEEIKRVSSEYRQHQFENKVVDARNNEKDKSSNSTYTE
jgi:hypothetical protein